MNQREAQELEGVLSHRFAHGEIAVIAQPGGARVLIEINGVSHKFSLGDGPSALLNHLVTGFAD
jgi:hypothetical protein